MPELPEVETIRLQLNSVIVGKTIKDVEIRKTKLFRGNKKAVLGKKIIKLRRFSKMLILDLTGGVSLAIHLKMTGRLVYQKSKIKNQKSKVKTNIETDYEKDKHTHVVIHFDDGSKLYFHDLRQFGFIQVILTGQIEKIDYIKSLGPEFFRNLDLNTFKKIVKSGTQPIKLLLIDQQKVAGAGNIYANEGLWCAKINPGLKAKDLTGEQVSRLFECMEKIMKQAIVWGGASDNNYRDAFGQKGEVQKYFVVYNREDKPCPRCKTKIQKITLGGRGTYFCPTCQRQ